MSNPDTELDRLFAVVRTHPVDTSRTELAFATRLQARLAEQRAASLTSWAWRLCPFFAVLALALAGWTQHWPADFVPGTASVGDVQTFVTLLSTDDSDAR